MKKMKVAVVGAGSIAQVAHIPVLKQLDDVEIVAICDVDKSKVSRITEKFEIPRWYYLIDNLLKNESLDAIHICTPNYYHFPMSYMALDGGVNVLVEKPIALNSREAEKLSTLARKKKLTLMVGMDNRFRQDVITARDFIRKGELGEVFYIKAGWIKKWERSDIQDWHGTKKSAGGGAFMDLGIQFLDLALFLTGMPKIKKVRLYDYSHNPDLDVEDGALAVIETVNKLTITIEVSWKMPLEHDMIYTNIYGKEGAAFLNPLRINKELHGNLVNVTPLSSKSNTPQFKRSFENEIRHFFKVMRGEEKNMSSPEEAIEIMRIVEALYESARKKEEVELA